MTDLISNNSFLRTAIHLIARHQWFMLAVIIIGLGVGIGGTIVFTDFEYRSEAQVLVVQYSDETTVDGEKILRSTEHIARNLAQIIGTTSFMDAVSSEHAVAGNAIAGSTESQRKLNWNRAVAASAVPNSGIIQIRVYDHSQEEAGLLADAVVQTLIHNAAEYHGASDFAVEVKQIDRVLTSERVVRPNMVIVVLVSLIGSFIAGLFYLFMVKEWRIIEQVSAQWRSDIQVKSSEKEVSQPVKKEAKQEPAVRSVVEEIKQVEVPAVQEKRLDDAFSFQPVEFAYANSGIGHAYQVLEHHNWSDRLQQARLALQKKAVNTLHMSRVQ